MTEIRSVLLDCFFKCEGRRYVNSGRLFLNASGASLKGRFRGENLSLTLFSEPVVKGRNAYIGLTLDGRRRRIRLPKGEKVLSFDLSAGEHTFEIVKLNESESNSLALSSAATDGKFLPVIEGKKTRIEFIGDSITTGFGVRAKRADEEYTTATQDVTLAYSYSTARALNAEMEVTAASGWGMYKSKYAEHAIPDFYENIDLTRNREKYDFSFRPDVIVLALGTNDFSYLADLAGAKKDKEYAALKSKSIAFIRKLLKRAPVVWVYGFSGSESQKGLPAFIEEVWRLVDCPNFYTLQVKDSHSLNDICAGHPGKRTHKLASRRLARFLRSLIGGV